MLRRLREYESRGEYLSFHNAMEPDDSDDAPNATARDDFGMQWVRWVGSCSCDRLQLTDWIMGYGKDDFGKISS